MRRADVRRMRRYMDRAGRWSARQPKPCSSCTDPACCEEPPICSPEEAAIVARAATPDALERIEAWKETGIVEVALRARRTLAASAARELRRMRVKCPFLIDGQCSVYEARPVACRGHIPFTDDPVNCRRYADGLVRIEHSGPMELFSAVGKLPRTGEPGLLPLLVEEHLRGADK